MPDDARRYIAHVEGGASLRALARATGCHPSTVLRQVRKLEIRRDDPLVDAALRRLGGIRRGARPRQNGRERAMTGRNLNAAEAPDEATLAREGGAVLRRLCEAGAALAVAQDMEKAVVVRELACGETARTAVVDAALAQALALQSWIACDAPGRVSRYRITAKGRAALDRLRRDAPAPGMAEAAAMFRPAAAEPEGPEALRPRPPHGETPLQTLARRREKSGKPFLTRALVVAGERLCDDYDLSRLDDAAPPDWSAVLRGDAPMPELAVAAGFGPEAAKVRLARALTDLGPGLGDMALRCCCLHEGLEATEKRLGWSARSGKIVLRIALQRLRRHYEQQGPEGRGMIG
ncbi:DUF6456 domain-containing protein [Roseivivax sp. CAU 1761]